MMAKQFKVGDKVRVLDVNFIDSPRVISRIDVFEVKHVTNIGGLRTNRLSDGAYLYFATDELRYVELLEAKPSKSERITQLESKVAALEATVASLQKRRKPAVALTQAPKYVFGIDLARPSPNERRKAVIERAKAFVGEGYDRWFNDRLCSVEFHVNSDKRTVVALLRGKRSRNVFTKAIAKCAPDDVFNADIGKAIALGRALGLDVSEFENAVKPTEVVVGMRVDTYIGEGFFKTVKPVKINGGNRMYSNFVTAEFTPYEPGDKITDDTDAKY